MAFGPFFSALDVLVAWFDMCECVCLSLCAFSMTRANALLCVCVLFMCVVHMKHKQKKTNKKTSSFVCSLRSLTNCPFTFVLTIFYVTNLISDNICFFSCSLPDRFASYAFPFCAHIIFGKTVALCWLVLFVICQRRLCLCEHCYFLFFILRSPSVEE